MEDLPTAGLGGLLPYKILPKADFTRLPSPKIWIYVMKIARFLVVFAAIISLIGVVIHVGALFAGLSWFTFFNAPPSIVASYKAGTLLAPLSGLAIAGLMGACSYYVVSAIGLVRRPPLQSVGLATMATICIVRTLLLPVLAIFHPELRNTFQIVAAIVWGFAGVGFAVGYCLVKARRKQSVGVTQLGDIA